MTVKIAEEFDINALHKEMEEIVSGRGVSLAAAEAIRDIFRRMDDQILSLQTEVEERGDTIEEFENEEDSAESAVNAVLDLVDRPVGTMKARLPQTPTSERALIALYDSVGRTL